MPRLIALLTGILLLASGCLSHGSDIPPAPDYTPVPDAELFSRVAAMPGVERSEFSFNDTWPENVYIGEVTIRPDADAQHVLDTIYATLRQGRYGADVNIHAQQNDRQVTFEAIDGPTSSIKLDERYGRQPGDGTPPDS